MGPKWTIKEKQSSALKKKNEPPFQGYPCVKFFRCELVALVHHQVALLQPVNPAKVGTNHWSETCPSYNQGPASHGSGALAWQCRELVGLAHLQRENILENIREQTRSVQ
jgi:hypothetical protein